MVDKVNILKMAKILSLVVVGVGMGSVAYGQNGMPEAGAFERLSPGNKVVAEALFNGQVVTDNGKAPLSLDLIAASKRRSGWGRIFRQLKRDGLIDARSLGELTSGRYQQRTVVKSARPPRATVVTTASGRQIIVDKNARARQARVNRGRSINRRGSAKVREHTEGILSNGSTYRGRLDYTGDNQNASALGIATGKGVGTSNFITSKPKR